ncbi:MAG TPA: septation protein A, partial [Telluria sp.]|nr:septation protein A [Telluria sp.]
MKFLFDLFPVLLFFAVYKIAGMYPTESFAFVQQYVSGFVADGAIAPDQGPIMVATLVAMLASLVQLTYVKARGRKIDVMLWLSVIVIVVFGGATIYLHDDTFIKWKPTILHWLYALVLLGGQFIFRKNLVREVMGAAVTLPDQVWNRLSMGWIAYFFLVGLVNLVVAFFVFKGDTDAWVNFKTFGLPGMTFAFLIGQSFYLSKYLQDEEPV